MKYSIVTEIWAQADAYANSGELTLIGRLNDYYKDEEFFILELPDIKDELQKVYKKSNEKIEIIPKLMLLCDLAVLYNTTICVIPD
ncbi:MAG: hypothetical protein ABJA57_08590 [Ginsengibacter sp.]